MAWIIELPPKTKGEIRKENIEEAKNTWRRHPKLTEPRNWSFGDTPWDYRWDVARGWRNVNYDITGLHGHNRMVFYDCGIPIVAMKLKGD